MKKIINFPDYNLETEIRKAISKPTGDIYLEDVSGLTSFSAQTAGISDLTGIQCLTNLTWLRLQYNQIVDISPLVSNTGIDNGDIVSIQNNLIDCVDQKSNLDTLIGRRVDLNYKIQGTSPPKQPDDHTGMIYNVYTNTWTWI